MSAHGQSQRIMALDDIQNLPLANDVNAVYGQAATLLTAPAGARLLVLNADKGTWRYALGDRTSSPAMPGTALPGAAITDGSGAMMLKEGDRIVLPGPRYLTVKGYAADSALTYYWV